jgi:hypothetical protein
MNVIELAEKAYEKFEQGTRQDGSKFWKTKDTDKPEWLKNMIFEVHGDKLPDDTTYEYIVDALEAISDCDDPEQIEERLFEIEADVYTSDLTEWLNKRNDHVYYLTEVLEEYGDIRDGFQLLALAQTKQRQEIAFDVLSKLQEIVDGINN